MNTTIKSLAMVAVALFAGFGSASAQEESVDEGVELTKDMWQKWDGVTKDAQPTDEKVYIDWNIGPEEFAGGAVMCGTSTVAMDVYADLSDYNYLVIYGSGPNPRVMLNRTTENGQQADGGMIELRPSYGEETGAAIINLKKDLVRTPKDAASSVDDYAHLVTIKANWGEDKSNISSIYLYNTLPEDLAGGATGIKNVNVANDAVVATFNAAGAKVAANAKGLVIKKFQNGKVVKVMNK